MLLDQINPPDATHSRTIYFNPRTITPCKLGNVCPHSFSKKDTKVKRREASKAKLTRERRYPVQGSGPRSRSQ